MDNLPTSEFSYFRSLNHRGRSRWSCKARGFHPIERGVAQIEGIRCRRYCRRYACSDSGPRCGRFVSDRWRSVIGGECGAQVWWENDAWQIKQSSYSDVVREEGLIKIRTFAFDH